MEMRILLAAGAVLASLLLALAACGSSAPSAACLRAVAADDAYAHSMSVDLPTPLNQMSHLAYLQVRAQELCPAGTRYEKTTDWPWLGG